MVENNKIKAIDEHGRKLHEQIQQLQALTEEHNKKFDQVNSHLEVILAILRTNSGSRGVERTNTSPGELIPNQMMNQRGNEILNQRCDGMGLII